MNPMKSLPLFTKEVISIFKGRSHLSLPPHIFSVASKAYRHLLETNKSQTIVLSGIQGSGKTECSKYILKYLVKSIGVSPECTKISESLLVANKILEAFGNAVTPMNTNSSRFAQTTKVFFDTKGSICGARISTYLLEKNRVVGEYGPGERNFHIFYQLAVGISKEERNRIFMNSPKSFTFLNSQQIEYEDIDDLADFKRTQTCMEMVGFSKLEIANVEQILAAILYIGNLHFDSNNGNSVISSKKCLEIFSNLLGCSPEVIETAFCCPSIVNSKNNTMQKVFLSKEKAMQSSLTLAKFIYHQLFSWIVYKINKHLAPRSSEEQKKASKLNSFISIVDPKGFENFGQGRANGIDQLCNNYITEKLQARIMTELCEKPQKEYSRVDGLAFPKQLDLTNHPMNAASVLDRIMAELEEECKQPRSAGSTNFLQKVSEKETKQNVFVLSKKNPNAFAFRHSFGSASYDASRFVERNKEYLFSHLVTVMSKSVNALVSNMFTANYFAPHLQKVSAVSLHNTVFNRIVEEMSTTGNHYVFCLSPSFDTEKEFDPLHFLSQIKYSGIVDSVIVQSHSFARSFSFSEFVWRYRCLLPKTVKMGVVNQEVASKVFSAICFDFKKKKNDTWYFSKDNIFVKEEVLRYLENKREQVRINSAKFLLSCMLRRKFASRIKALAKTAVKRKATLQKLMMTNDNSKLDIQQIRSKINQIVVSIVQSGIASVKDLQAEPIRRASVLNAITQILEQLKNFQP